MDDPIERILVFLESSVQASLVENIDWDMRNFTPGVLNVAEISF
jgi:hypothetical protein